MYLTLFRGLSLSEYIECLHFDCQTVHTLPCARCSALLSVASHVLEHGFYTLSAAYKTAFPHLHYRSQNALELLLQMPLAGVRIGDPKSGMSSWYLLEFVEGVNYAHVVQFLEATGMSHPSSLPIKRHELKALLGLAQSDRERELIRYTAFKSSGLTVTGARKNLGLENMKQRGDNVLMCIQEAQEIREAVDKLSHLQDKALLDIMGLTDTELAEAQSDSDSVPSDTEQDMQDYSHIHSNLFSVLKESHYNWFEVVDHMENEGESVTPSILEQFHCYVLTQELTQQQKECFETSCAAFEAAKPTPDDNRTACLLSGDIVSESESDNPEDYVGLHSLASDHAKTLLRKKRLSNARRAQRYKAKKIAEQHFLGRKRSKSVQSIATHFPDIGEAIESFVTECNVGADAWRRTGILTFDGNIKVREKVTYSRIQDHLQEKYKCKISYGTVVQLCVARNRRRRSAKNYKGLAKVTTRRARKGFQVKYNPDKHWSAAFYRNLNLIQYTDGSNITNINRDDASGFRLDTLATHSKHGTAAVLGHNVLTTHTDYVNKYPSLLQTTSYNFSATKTTKEMAAGIVKGSKAFPKNPAQHFADLKMLTQLPTFESVFFHSSGPVKAIECIRVDGSCDEGPTHEEVRFWWTVRHLEQGNIVTLLTSRASGSSYLNRVELQNGCLALGHSNLFIPSTLGGSVYNEETGNIDMDKVRKNLDQAASVYIKRVNNCPFGETVIQLFKGANSSELQCQRKHLMVYLKGSRKKRDELKSEQPDLYKYFDKVAEIKRRHEVNCLPATSQYLFHLVCCFEKDCPHPVCHSGKHLQLKWFEGGPAVTDIPLPVPDPSHPWGNTDCTKCKGFCAGHYLTAAQTLTTTSTAAEPPSHILKKFYNQIKDSEPTDDTLKAVAAQCLLPVDDVSLWLEHLRTIDRNRRRGAAKAAKSRRSKIAALQNPEEQEYYCGKCGGLFGEGEEEYWIGCDGCWGWFHGVCVTVTPETEPEQFFCERCSSI